MGPAQVSPSDVLEDVALARRNEAFPSLVIPPAMNVIVEGVQDVHHLIVGPEVGGGGHVSAVENGEVFLETRSFVSRS